MEPVLDYLLVVVDALIILTVWTGVVLPSFVPGDLLSHIVRAVDITIAQLIHMLVRPDINLYLN